MCAAPTSLTLVITDMRLSFPSDEELLSAIRGHHIGDQPLCGFAREFGILHEQLLETSGAHAEIARRRDELAVEVDTWVAARLPVPHPNASLHTETVGRLLDRIAEAQVHAYRLLMTISPDDPRVHAAWYRLAELVDGYTDLTREVIQRARRLPALGDRR